MASKTLTAKVDFDIRSAEKKLERLNKLIVKINKVVDTKAAKSGVEKAAEKAILQQERLKQATLRTQLAEERLTAQKNKTALAAQKLKDATDKSANSAHRLNSAFKTSTASANHLLTTVRRLASTYLGVMGMKAMIGTSDTITSTQNKLNNINDGDAALTQNQMDKMYASANKVRMGYTDMLSNASKSMTLASDAFQGDMDNAIRFQEIMAETYALGGASAPEMSTSMYQMIQALGSGTLQGDELRSVREGAPLAYKAIEEFAQGVYNTEESLKDLASQGKITSEMVVAAIMNAGSSIDAQFNQTAITFGQAWNRVKNAAVKAFEPVSKALNDMLNQAAKNGAFETIESAFWNISKALQIAFKIIYNSIAWIADNWEWLKHILIVGLMLYASCLIVTTALAIKAAYLRIKLWMVEHAKMLKAIGVIAIIAISIYLLIQVFQAWKQGAINTCTAIISALAIVGVAILLIGIILGSTALMIIGGVLLILGAIFMFFEEVCYGAAWLAAWIVNIVFGILNYIIGGFAWLGGTVYNIATGAINAIIQYIWAQFVDPISGIIEWFVNAFNGGFNGILGAGANAIGQLVSMFLSGLKVITKAIDSIAGTSLSEKISGWQDKAKSWGKNENAVTYSVKSPEIPRLDATWLFNTGSSVLSYVDANAWGSAAGNWGAGVKDSINGWGSKFQNTTSNDKSSLLDNMGKALGLDFGNLGSFPSIGDPTYDTSGAYKQPTDDDMIKNALGDIGDIADNTGSMADSMELTKEDLEYLRRIADTEWKKEFTTANITVDMSNYNTINGDNDLDGIVTKLADKLYEEMNSVADGVYS